MKKLIILFYAITIIVSNYAANNDPWSQNLSKTFLSKVEKARNPKFYETIKDFKFLSKAAPDELINYYNYKAEKHLVTTEDGYIITLHRIAGNKTSPSPNGKPAVLLQHGLFCSAMTWLVPGPDRSLAFILADRGFDVWLANSRGSEYSRSHNNYEIYQSEFWNFSWHEIGIYDLSAEIDYILQNTGHKKIAYVGHSQGTAASYVLLSERPEYNSKISSIHSLAPTAFYNYINPIAKIASQTILNLHVNIFNNYYEVVDVNKNTKNLFAGFCNKHSITQPICKQLIFLATGYSEEQFDAELYSLVFKHYPTASSIKQVLHYNQLIVSGRFKKYDYGLMNWSRYRKFQAPNYNIRNIKVPTTIHYANNDMLSAPKDVEYLYSKLPNPNGLYMVNHPSFNHMDFLFGKDVKRLVYNNLTSLLLQDEL